MLAANERVERETISEAIPWERTDSQPRVRPSTHPHTSKMNLVSLWGCILLGGALFWWIAGQGAKIDAANYQIDHLQTAIQQQQAENASLTTQVDSLLQPSRILSIATQLGAHYASPKTIVVKSKH